LNSSCRKKCQFCGDIPWGMSQSTYVSVRVICICMCIVLLSSRDLWWRDRSIICDWANRGVMFRAGVYSSITAHQCTCNAYITHWMFTIAPRSHPPSSLPRYAPAHVANTLLACHMEWCEVCSMWPQARLPVCPQQESWVGALRRTTGKTKP